MKMTNKIYNILKYVALIVMPALVIFMSSIGDIWGITWMPKVVSTISAIGVLLGALLQVSTNKYWKGEQDNGGTDSV